MMKNKLYIAAAACLIAVAASSCKGRYADATPNGEVVTVTVPESSDSTNMQSGQPVVTEVQIVNSSQDKK